VRQQKKKKTRERERETKPRQSQRELKWDAGKTSSSGLGKECCGKLRDSSLNNEVKLYRLCHSRSLANKLQIRPSIHQSHIYPSILPTTNHILSNQNRLLFSHLFLVGCYETFSWGH